MLIFNIFKIRKLYKEAKENPGKAVAGELSGALAGAAFLPAVVFGALLVAVFILGFTSVIYKPLLIARVLFYILLPVYLAAFFVTWRVIRRIKSKAASMLDFKNQ